MALEDGGTERPAVVRIREEHEEADAPGNRIPPESAPTNNETTPVAGDTAEAAPQAQQDARTLERRLSGQDSIEVREPGGEWRPLSQDEQDTFFNFDKWKRQHPGQTPPPGMFSIHFENEREPEPNVGAASGGVEHNPHIGTPLSREDIAGNRAALEARLRALEANGHPVSNAQVLRDRIASLGHQHDVDDIDTLLRRFEPRPIVGEQNRAGRENEPTAQKVAQQLAQRHGTRPADVVPGPGNGGPELPRWAGQYGASWTDFDPSLYADVKNIKTIPEIRSNTLYNNLFGELAIAVDSSRASSLEKLARNEPLSGDDRLFFGYIQYELSKNIQECEWVEKNLSSKDLELMMSKDDDFRFFVAQNGVERTTQAFKERIFHKACQNKGEFSSFRDSLKDLKDNQKTGRAQKAERETKMWCDRFGIPPSRIGDFYDPNNRRQSEDRLAARIHERAGKFRKSIDWLENKLPKEITLLGSSSSSAARAIEEQRKNAPEKFSWSDPRSWVTGDRFGGIAENRQNMLDFLSVTVSDVEFRHAIEREAFLGEKVVPSIESGPASFGEMKGMLTKDANSQEAIRKRIRSIVDSDRHWNDKTPQEQDAVLRSHKATESLGQTKGMGFFAWILRAFFGFEYTKAASEELGRPVHI